MGLTSMGRRLLATQDGVAVWEAGWEQSQSQHKDAALPTLSAVATGQGEPEVPRPAGGDGTLTRGKTHGDLGTPKGAPSPGWGFSAAGAHTQCSGKRALGSQRELRAEDAGRRFAPRAPPRTARGPGAPSWTPQFALVFAF